ncbi:unnamed protein product [Linum tenue]|uniref:Uncharacterized protein n=1 Tax=Linum tenue TaxID=586396 RepID=A0AAV0IK62_9ROSI|nr:unnamed protein product [Linum tenue]
MRSILQCQSSDGRRRGFSHAKQRDSEEGFQESYKGLGCH